MSNEEIIKRLSGNNGPNWEKEMERMGCWGDAKALREAIALLRTRQDAQPNEPQGDGWISVEDRLPEFTGHYLLCITNTENSVAVVVSGVYFNDSKSFNFMNVTHWRPMPGPPKEDER